MKRFTIITILLLCGLMDFLRADVTPMDANSIQKYVTQITNLPIANTIFPNHYQMVASKKNVSVLPD